MSKFGKFVGFVTNVKKRYFAGFVQYVEFFEAYWITYRWQDVTVFVDKSSHKMLIIANSKIYHIKDSQKKLLKAKNHLKNKARKTAD